MSIATLKAESKKVVRNPIAKAVITWTDPLIDLSIIATASEENRISYTEQTADLVTEVPRKWFHTNDTDVTLDGTWYPMPSTLLEARRSQVGWWGTQNADGNGDFATPVVLTTTFSDRLVIGFTVAGDSALNEYPVDFTIMVQQLNGSTYSTVEILTVTGNTEVVYSALFQSEHSTTARLILTITKWSTPGKIVKISEFYSSITEVFEQDQLLYMNLLEEFESSDGTLPVGNISANELDISIQNLDDRFFVGNTNSNIHTFIKRNRKIEPYYGFEYTNGTKEYIPKGLFWSGDWTVNDLDTGAQTSARDRMELLRKETFPYEDHFTEVLYNVSIKTLLTTVLNSITAYMYDFFYDIDDLDDTYVVPVVLPEFFEKKNYFDVIKELTAASLAYAYIDLPTDEEVTENGVLNKDMLRIKKVTTVFPSEDVEEGAEVIEKRDYINKTQPANTEELANIINVTYKEFTQPEPVEDPEKWEDEEYTFTVEDSASITEYGRLSYDYDSSDFIQLEDHASDIAAILLASYKTARKDVDVNSYGDITQKLANRIDVPEYQKNGLDTRGIFAIKKLFTEFNGSLRIGIGGRKIVDSVVPVEYLVVQDTDGATTKWQDVDGAPALYQDSGV